MIIYSPLSYSCIPESKVSMILGVKLVSLGLCMLIAFNSLVATPALEKQALDWIRTLVHEEKYFQSGKIVKKIQIHYFQNHSVLSFSNPVGCIRLNLHLKLL